MHRKVQVYGHDVRSKTSKVKMIGSGRGVLEIGEGCLNNHFVNPSTDLVVYGSG